MDKKRLAEIYSEIAEEEYYKYTPDGWKNSIICNNVATLLDFNNVRYLARLIKNCIAVYKYFKLNKRPCDNYLKRAKDITKIAIAIDRKMNNKELIVSIAHLKYIAGEINESRKLLDRLSIDYVKSNFHALLLTIKLNSSMAEPSLIETLKENFIDEELSYLYYALASNCIKYGMYSEAIDLINISLDYKIDNVFSYNKLGFCYLYSANPEMSLKVYYVALDLLPDFSHVYMNIAKLYSLNHEYKKAFKVLKEAIKTNPNMYNAYNDLGIIYFKKKMYLSSIDAYKKAIRIKPDYHIVFNNLGIVLKEIGSYEESEKAYKKAIEINPRYYQAYNNLGTLLNKQERYQESIKYYKKALHINPKYRNAYANLEKVYDIIESKQI